MKRRHALIWSVMGVACGLWFHVGRAQTVARRDTNTFAISGQRLVKPDLTWALLPRFEDLTEGNAATKYLAAAMFILRVSEEKSEKLNRLANAAEVPLEALDLADADLVEALGAYSMFKTLGEGARMESADWETNMRVGGIGTLIPWTQEMRQMARHLVLRIRVSIKKHDWRAAQMDLQTGYAMARHMGMGESLIESLVGLAIAGRMNECAKEWIAEPGSPNLYWPLSNLPAPFNDMRRPMESESGFAFYELPGLRRMKEGDYSIEAWKEVIGGIPRISGGVTLDAVLRPADALLRRELLPVGAGVGMYPEAKRFLKARGASAEEMEKMPVAEALGRYFVGSYLEDRDDVFKWMGLPPAQAMAGLKEWEREFQEKVARREVNLLAGILLPSLGRAVQQRVRQDRQIAGLRIVEAVRAYAAEKGELPERLDQLTLPVPTDPAGTAFEYWRVGNSAVVSSGAGEREAVRFEVTLRK